MRDVIGCGCLRYGPGPVDWPLVACRAAKAWPLRNTRCGTFRGVAGCVIWMGKNTNNLNIHYPGIASYVENMHDNGVIDETLEQGGFKMRIPMHHLSMS